MYYKILYFLEFLPCCRLHILSGQKLNIFCAKSCVQKCAIILPYLPALKDYSLFCNIQTAKNSENVSKSVEGKAKRKNY